MSAHNHSVNKVVLENGAEGLFIHIPDATVMVLQFNFRAGHYLVEDTRKWETPHIMEHLSLGANKKYPIARAFEAELGKNGAYANASTGSYHVTYDAECADFEWERVLDLMILAVSEPLFQEADFAAERGNVRDEMVSRSNNHFRTLYTASAIKYGMIGKSDQDRVAEMDNVTIEDVRRHYEQTHTTKNMRFVIAGNISGRESQIIGKLEAMPMKKGDGRIELPDEIPRAFDSPLYIPKESVPNVYFDIGTYAKGKYKDPEWDAATLLNNMLTETLYSKILGEARERGLVYSMWSGFETLKSYVGWSIGGQALQTNLPALLDIAVREIKKVTSGDIDDADIDASKQFALGRFQRGAQTVSGVASGYAGRYYQENVIDDYFSFPERIKNVEKDMIVQVMRHLFSENIAGISFLGTADMGLIDDVKDKTAVLWRP